MHFYQLCLSLQFVFYFWLRYDGPRTKVFRLSLSDYLRDGPIKNNKKQKQKQHIIKKNFSAFHRWSQKRCLVRGKIPASPKISRPPLPPRLPIILLKWFIPKLYTWLFGKWQCQGWKTSGDGSSTPNTVSPGLFTWQVTVLSRNKTMNIAEI